MISIARDLDAFDIAQEIRQERQVHKGSFLLLEGDKDIKRFGKFTDEARCSIVNCFGRENLIGAIEILYEDAFPGALGLADADFDRLNGELNSHEGLIFSECHDFDLDVACSTVMDRYLAEVAHDDKCEEHGGVIGIREWLFKASKPLSVLRFISHIQKLGYRLTDIRHRDILAENSEINVDLMVESVSLGKNSDVKQKNHLKGMVNSHLQKVYDAYQITNGHDFLTMLGIALRSKLSDRHAAQTWGSEVELHFRLSYSDEDFAATPTFAAIVNWQDENPPYIILKTSLMRSRKQLPS